MRGQVTRDVRYLTLDDECVAVGVWLETVPYDRIIQTLGTVRKLIKTM